MSTDFISDAPLAPEPPINRFLTATDYGATIHAEITTSLTRGDDFIVQVCEDRAIAEMRGYMSARYDTDAIFAARGDNRLPLVVMMCLDIAVYHIHCVGNPLKLSEMRKERYKRAVEWLKAVQKGVSVIAGAPLREAEQLAASGIYRMVSNKKRFNHF